MPEEIITKQYKTKDSKLFDSKEEAEKYEEVLEFFNYFKDFCTDDNVSCNCKIIKDENKNYYDVKCLKYDDRLRCRLTFIVRHYDEFKKFFDVDDLKIKLNI